MGGNTLGNGKGGIKGPTLSPEAAAAAAEHRAGGAGTPSGLVIGTDAQGNTITSGVSWAKGSEQSAINGLPPKEKIALQKKMASLGLYPQGYTPAYNGLVGQEDYNAILKLQNIGTQIGKGDINDVIATAQKDSKIRNFLATGGQSTASPKTYTSEAEASSYLTSQYLDLFNEKPSKADIKAYTSAIVSKEKASKSALTSQEREDVLLSITQKRVSELATSATGGDAKASALLDEGQLGKAIRAIRSTYDNNGIPVDDKTVYQLAGKAIRNRTAYDNVMEQINLNAKTQWTAFSDIIDKGGSVKSGLQPYISLKSRTLGLPESQIKVQDMTDVLNPDGSLKKFADYGKYLYGTSDYLSSDSYKSKVVGDTKALISALKIG